MFRRVRSSMNVTGLTGNWFRNVSSRSVMKSTASTRKCPLPIAGSSVRKSNSRPPPGRGGRRRSCRPPLGRSRAWALCLTPAPLPRAREMLVDRGSLTACNCRSKVLRTLRNSGRSFSSFSASTGPTVCSTMYSTIGSGV